MARPTTPKTAPIYRHTFNKGTYRITYQAPSGAKRQGLPYDDLTDIVNLTKVGGSTNAPPFIVTSEADFKASFVEYDPVRANTPEGTRTDTV